ncbi:PAS domain S-box protein [Prosthecobacter sp.]|uniref:hybrid sensor histidine kinase/response regulator n=1 Tax=Prosthecobacter sp. TaxID=1965333 RepID=UPI0024892453|nr:PAS domain S-box protein [Prosthecobacter sp.]MDI1312266.1 PAS domain S-box protein [Prosthecobacter sp.]
MSQSSSQAPNPHTEVEELRAANAELRARLEEAEETLRAIHNGEVDALVVQGESGTQIFTLQGTETEANQFRGDILSQISDSVVALDQDQHVTYLNAAAEKQYGITASAALGRNLHDLWTTQWASPEVEAAAAAALQNEGCWRGESIHIKRNGEKIHVESAVIRLNGADDRVIGSLATIRDITERRHTEDRLAEQSRLLDLSADAIFVCDASNRITYWSQGAEASYGFTREEALGRLKHELLRTKFPQPLAQILEQLQQDGRWTGELKHMRKDGSVIIDSARWVLDRDPQGRSASILETNTDVTERRRAEAALSASEEKFRSLIQSLPAAVYTCDCEGRIQLYNAAAAELWGREPEIGKDLWCGSWRIYNADGSPMELIHSPMARTLHSGRAVQEDEIVVERPDKTRRHVLPCPNPIFDADGIMTGAVNMLLDITELKRTESLLRDAKDAAELANQSKDRFLAVLSHELRTPLTPVLLTLAALEQEATLLPEARDDLRTMKRNIELEIRLIDDLLDLSRITSGKLTLDIEAVDLNEIVRQVSSICSPQLSEQLVFLEVELDGEAGMVAADSARLQQVLWNVLKNAIKFTPESGVIQVSTLRRNDGFCEVRVQDPGIGIPAERLPHVFNAFEQGGTKITRQFGGLGLGLAICKALMELHHGSIRAESAGVGQGATFIIELPSKTMTTTAKIRLMSPQPSITLPPLKLLLVEDHADTARILSRQLVRAGVTVTQASDVSSAIKLLEQESFDLLVSDLGLPDGSGYDIMRRASALRGIPGIAMSGYGMEEDMRRSREAGFSEHLVKPIDLRELITAIRSVSEVHAK